MLESISTISVSALGVIVTVLFYLRDKRKIMISDMAKQIQAYWCLEKEYCKEVVDQRNSNVENSKKTTKYKQVLEEFRKKAQYNPSNNNQVRPTYTANQVRNRIS